MLVTPNEICPTDGFGALSKHCDSVMSAGMVSRYQVGLHGRKFPRWAVIVNTMTTTGLHRIDREVPSSTVMADYNDSGLRTASTVSDDYNEQTVEQNNQ
jgi:hypothetical protein